MIILLCILAYGAIAAAVAYIMGRFFAWQEPRDPVITVSIFWPLVACALPLIAFIVAVMWAAEQGWKK